MSFMKRVFFSYSNIYNSQTKRKFYLIFVIVSLQHVFVKCSSLVNWQQTSPKLFTNSNNKINKINNNVNLKSVLPKTTAERIDNFGLAPLLFGINSIENTPSLNHHEHLLNEYKNAQISSNYFSINKSQFENNVLVEARKLDDSSRKLNTNSNTSVYAGSLTSHYQVISICNTLPSILKCQNRQHFLILHRVLYGVSDAKARNQCFPRTECTLIDDKDEFNCTGSNICVFYPNERHLRSCRQIKSNLTQIHITCVSLNHLKKYYMLKNRKFDQKLFELKLKENSNLNVNNETVSSNQDISIESSLANGKNDKKQSSTLNVNNSNNSNNSSTTNSTILLNDGNDNANKSNEADDLTNSTNNSVVLISLTIFLSLIAVILISLIYYKMKIKQIMAATSIGVSHPIQFESNLNSHTVNRRAISEPIMLEKSKNLYAISTQMPPPPPGFDNNSNNTLSTYSYENNVLSWKALRHNCSRLLNMMSEKLNQLGELCNHVILGKDLKQQGNKSSGNDEEVSENNSNQANRGTNHLQQISNKVKNNLSIKSIECEQNANNFYFNTSVVEADNYDYYQRSSGNVHIQSIYANLTANRNHQIRNNNSFKSITSQKPAIKQEDDEKESIPKRKSKTATTTTTTTSGTSLNDSKQSNRANSKSNLNSSSTNSYAFDTNSSTSSSASSSLNSDELLDDAHTNDIYSYYQRSSINAYNFSHVLYDIPEECDEQTDNDASNFQDGILKL